MASSTASGLLRDCFSPARADSGWADRPSPAPPMPAAQSARAVPRQRAFFPRWYEGERGGGLLRQRRGRTEEKVKQRRIAPLFPSFLQSDCAGNRRMSCTQAKQHLHTTHAVGTEHTTTAGREREQQHSSTTSRKKKKKSAFFTHACQQPGDFPRHLFARMKSKTSSMHYETVMVRKVNALQS